MVATRPLTNADRKLAREGTPHRLFINDYSAKRYIVRSSGSFAGHAADSRRAYAHGVPRRERDAERTAARRRFRATQGVTPKIASAPLHQHACEGCGYRHHCERTDCAKVSYGTCSACRMPHMHHRHGLAADSEGRRGSSAPTGQDRVTGTSACGA